jgi:succinate dehydrogenase flavin-adding protein (antitoxin of CptAB toxin-antitoxin module)
MKNNTSINILEVEKLFKEYCEENKIEFSEKKFEEFLKFLEMDFYDWVKGNLKQFENQ